MDDTSPEIKKKMIEMIQQKTPEERAKMGCSMYQTSRTLVIRYIKENNPNISPSELRQEIFLKFYRNDFSQEQIEKILQHLKNLE